MDVGPLLVVLGFVLMGVVILDVAFWIVVAMHVRAAGRSLPDLDAGCAAADQAADLPPVTIIMPAHDEARVLDEALTAIRRTDHPDWQLVVVADRCTDSTPDIARRHAAEDPRIRLVVNAESPEDWTGKTWACHLGAAESRPGDWLLFTDADTLFAPDLVRASIGVMRTADVAFLSLLGHLGTAHEFERVAQPVAAMALMRMFPLARVNRRDPARRRPFANGQFMFFRPEAYRELGGHDAVRRAILEDLRLAQRARRANIAAGTIFGGPRFRVRMYDCEADFRCGWKRILIEGTNRHVPRLRRIALRLRMHVVVLGLEAIAVGIAVALLAARDPLGLVLLLATGLALAIRAAVLTVLYRLQGMDASRIRHHPRGCLEIAALVDEAIADVEQGRGIEWARRTYAVEAAGEE